MRMDLNGAQSTQRDWIGVTGTRHLRELYLPPIRNRLEQCSVNSVLVSGACVGLDELVAKFGQQRCIDNYIIVPANRSRVFHDWKAYATYYEEMAPGTDYRARNQRLVILSTKLLAFPEYPEHHPRSLRSGTWMTVRLARRAAIPVEEFVLSELVSDT